jgi:hypothetical protein
LKAIPSLICIWHQSRYYMTLGTFFIILGIFMFIVLFPSLLRFWGVWKNPECILVNPECSFKWNHPQIAMLFQLSFKLYTEVGRVQISHLHFVVTGHLKQRFVKLLNELRQRLPTQILGNCSDNNILKWRVPWIPILNKTLKIVAVLKEIELLFA